MHLEHQNTFYLLNESLPAVERLLVMLQQEGYVGQKKSKMDFQDSGENANTLDLPEKTSAVCTATLPSTVRLLFCKKMVLLEILENPSFEPLPKHIHTCNI